MGFHLPVNRNPAVPIVPIQPFEIFSLFALNRVSGGLWLPVLTMVEEQWEAFAMSRLWIPVLGGDEFVTNWWEVPWRRLPLPTLCVTILYHRCRWPRARRSHLIVFARGFKQGAGEGRLCLDER